MNNEQIADDFYIDHMEQLDHLDAIFNEQHLDNNSPHEALKALYAIRDYCLQFGSPGQIYYNQTYEQLHNSKNPCFSFEEVILKSMQGVEPLAKG